VNINAYHQPGVEAGKKAATAVIELQLRVRQMLTESSGLPKTAAELGALLGADAENVYHALVHLSANTPGLRLTPGSTPAEDRFLLS
jgi:glucose-6-phosphate isomerase